MEMPCGIHTSQDKSLKRILKAVDKLKKCKPEVKLTKYQEIVRYIVDAMLSRKKDVLLQTTALWSLINLVNLDKIHGPEIMIQAGVPGAVHAALSSESLSVHSQKYASELVSVLCSHGQSAGVSDEVSLQFSLMKSGFRDNSSVGTGGDDSSIGQHSALASFSPYCIDQKNVEIMNQLFDTDNMWKDINHGQAGMHKLGAALDQDSIDGDETSVKTGHSSLTDFWDAMSKRYNYPAGFKGPGSRHGTRIRTSNVTAKSESITRSRLQEATMAGRHVATSRTQPIPAGKSPSRRPASQPRLFRLSPDVMTTRRPADSLVGDSLLRLDPLSINVSTALRTYVLEQRKRAEGIPAGGDDVSILIEARDGDAQSNCGDNQGQMQSTIGEYDDSDELGHDQEVSNTYFVSRVKSTASNRTRIRAEKLRDMKFLRNFFVGKATMGDTQELIKKMQDILELMDKDDTGYVTWKCFGRVLVSLAPRHLVRSDVTAFLDAQVDNEDDLIDYREFAISGKVLILETKEGVNEVLARSWYSRQKGNKAILEGDPASVYTWKNHVQWYRKRKAEAMIWLMRRANRAIQYYAYVETAQSYLVNMGKWGKALGYLLECGDRALAAIDSSTRIRESLMARAVHARRYRVKREEARRFLIAIADTVEVVADGTFKKIEPVVPQVPPNRIFPKLSKVYKVMYQFDLAFKWLLEAAARAEEKMRRKDEAFEFLSTLGQSARRQIDCHAQMQQVLQQIAERAREYCCVSDSALLYLLRRGEGALNFFDKQVDALNGLLQIGIDAKVHVSKQWDTFEALRTLGQQTLAKCNTFESALGYLLFRCDNAVRLRDEKIAAYNFLTNIPRKVFQNEDNLLSTYMWLCKRGEHAKKHMETVTRAYKRLTTLALRSVAVSRRRRMAQADLTQIGFSALRYTFEKLWVPLPGNKDRLNDEIKNLKLNDKRVAVVRKELSEEDRWKAELMDAFGGLCIAYSRGDVTIAGLGRSSRTGNAVSNDDLPELGRLGFKKLIMDGKLLGLPSGTADASYESVDTDASGCVSFDEVWTWFLFKARACNSRRRGSVNFTAATILPAKERALSVLMKRFNKTQPKVFISSTPDEMSAYES